MTGDSGSMSMIQTHSLKASGLKNMNRIWAFVMIIPFFETALGGLDRGKCIKMPGSNWALKDQHPSGSSNKISSKTSWSAESAVSAFVTVKSSQVGFKGSRPFRGGTTRWRQALGGITWLRSVLGGTTVI